MIRLLRQREPVRRSHPVFVRTSHWVHKQRQECGGISQHLSGDQRRCDHRLDDGAGYTGSRTIVLLGIGPLRRSCDNHEGGCIQRFRLGRSLQRQWTPGAWNPQFSDGRRHGSTSADLFLCTSSHEPMCGRTDGYWCDVGNLEAYGRLTDILSGTFLRFRRDRWCLDRTAEV